MTRIGSFFEIRQMASKLDSEWPWAFRTHNYAIWAKSSHSESFWLPNEWPTQKNGQNGFGRNFCTPKIDLFGVGWPNFFSPYQRESQNRRKKFLMPCNPFWESVGLPESKTAESRPKNAILQKFLHPKSTFLGRVVEIFSARIKGVLKASGKFFGEP